MCARPFGIQTRDQHCTANTAQHSTAHAESVGRLASIRSTFRWLRLRGRTSRIRGTRSTGRRSGFFSPSTNLRAHHAQCSAHPAHLCAGQVPGRAIRVRWTLLWESARCGTRCCSSSTTSSSPRRSSERTQAAGKHACDHECRLRTSAFPLPPSDMTIGIAASVNLTRTLRLAIPLARTCMPCCTWRLPSGTCLHSPRWPSMQKRSSSFGRCGGTHLAHASPTPMPRAHVYSRHRATCVGLIGAAHHSVCALECEVCHSVCAGARAGDDR